jgi:predicted nucleotidyltransferase
MLLTRPEQLRIELPLEDIARVCQKFGVSELSVFGSVLREAHREILFVGLRLLVQW